MTIIALLLRALAALALLLGLVGGPALAQTAAYPAKPIRLIVPFPPGAGTDTVARLRRAEAGRRAEGGDRRRQPDRRRRRDRRRRGGAGGPRRLHAAVRRRRRSPRSPRRRRTAGYDPVKQFVAVAPIASGPLAFVVGNAVPVANDAGIHRARQAEAGHAQLRLGGPRQRQPPRAGTAQGAHRHRHRPRPVQGHRAGDARPPVRPDPGDDRVDPGDAAVRRAEQAAGPRRHRQAPRRAASRRAVVAGGRRPTPRSSTTGASSRRPARRARSSPGSTRRNAGASSPSPTCANGWNGRAPSSSPAA